MTSPEKRVQLNTGISEAVYRDQPSFWDKVGSATKKALPYITRAASGFANSPSISQVPGYDAIATWEYTPTRQPVSLNSNIQPRPMPPQPLPDYTPSRTAQDALARINRLKNHQPFDWAQAQTRTNRIVDSLSSAKGPPTYEELHRQQGVSYNVLARQSGWNAHRLLQHSVHPAMPIQEDYRQIQRHLSYAQQPTRQPISPQHSGHSSMLDMIHQVASKMPPITFFDKEAGTVRDLAQDIASGKVLSDRDLKQLFHEFDLQTYGAEDSYARIQDQDNIKTLKQQLAFNMVYGSERLETEDGYIVIGDEAFNARTAYAEAWDYLEYFQKYEETRAPRFPTDPKLVDFRKHDITKRYNSLREQIAYELETNYQQKGSIDGLADNIMGKIRTKFPNNGPLDTQGQYGLPGQAVVRNPRTREPLRHTNGPQKGQLVTIDQYAWYNGQAVRAGYLSNYIYGYASAAGHGHAIIMHVGAQAAGSKTPSLEALIKSQIKEDNPSDIEAYVKGFKDYIEDLDRRYYLEVLKKRNSQF